VELSLPGRELVDGMNALAFEVPGFPGTRDPYIYIYDLQVSVRFDE
jgi:hypothetical protein